MIDFCVNSLCCIILNPVKVLSKDYLHTISCMSLDKSAELKPNFLISQVKHMNRVKAKQVGLISTGFKRWPFKLIKHFADTTCVLPFPVGPVGICPLNCLNLINLKFQVRALNGC